MRTEDQIAWRRDQVIALQEAIIDVKAAETFEFAKPAALAVMRTLLDMHRSSISVLEANFDLTLAR